jgi:hypothetical protein
LDASCPPWRSLPGSCVGGAVIFFYSFDCPSPASANMRRDSKGAPVQPGAFDRRGLLKCTST